MTTSWGYQIDDDMWTGLDPAPYSRADWDDEIIARLARLSTHYDSVTACKLVFGGLS